MAYELPKLQYEYNALEPYIDAKTMEIHHTKHHQAYINNLNKALENYPDMLELDIKDLLTQVDQLPGELITPVRNNGGGHYNHSLFWNLMTPNKTKPHPEGPLYNAIIHKFQTFANFKKVFSEAALKRFGSGWAWLYKDLDGTIEVNSTPNQDNPVMDGRIPILGLDVWEHAYYLKYQNKRAEYIENWWHVVNWPHAESLYQA